MIQPKPKWLSCKVFGFVQVMKNEQKTNKKKKKEKKERNVKYLKTENYKTDQNYRILYALRAVRRVSVWFAKKSFGRRLYISLMLYGILWIIYCLTVKLNFFTNAGSLLLLLLLLFFHHFYSILLVHFASYFFSVILTKDHKHTFIFKLLVNFSDICMNGVCAGARSKSLFALAQFNIYKKTMRDGYYRYWDVFLRLLFLLQCFSSSIFYTENLNRYFVFRSSRLWIEFCANIRSRYPCVYNVPFKHSYMPFRGLFCEKIFFHFILFVNDRSKMKTENEKVENTR